MQSSSSLNVECPDWADLSLKRMSALPLDHRQFDLRCQSGDGKIVDSMAGTFMIQRFNYPLVTFHICILP